MTEWHPFPVFLYGTLKRSQRNFFRMLDPENGRQKFIGTAVTVEAWPMILNPTVNAPFLLNQPGTGLPVIGELFQIDKKLLNSLDILEHHPHLYTRQKIQVTRLTDSEDSDLCLGISESRDQQLGQDHQLGLGQQLGHGQQLGQDHQLGQGQQLGQGHQLTQICEVYVLRDFKKSLLTYPFISQYDEATMNMEECDVVMMEYYRNCFRTGQIEVFQRMFKEMVELTQT